MPLLRSRLASARAKRTRFASSKALRRSSELLSGARLSIESVVYQRSLSKFSHSYFQIPRPEAVLPQVGCELLEHLAWLPNEAPRPHLHRRGPREHKLCDVNTARHPAHPDHRHPPRPPAPAPPPPPPSPAAAPATITCAISMPPVSPPPPITGPPTARETS